MIDDDDDDDAVAAPRAGQAFAGLVSPRVSSSARQQAQGGRKERCGSYCLGSFLNRSPVSKGAGASVPCRAPRPVRGASGLALGHSPWSRLWVTVRGPGGKYGRQATACARVLLSISAICREVGSLHV